MAATTVIEMTDASETKTEPLIGSDTKGIPIQRRNCGGKFQSQITKKDLLKVEITFLSVTFENPRLEKAFVVHDYRMPCGVSSHCFIRAVFAIHHLHSFTHYALQP